MFPDIVLIARIISSAVAGTLANAFAVAVFVSADKVSLALVPGRYGVALAVTAVLPFLYRLVRGIPGPFCAFAWLVLVPSLLAKTVFGASGDWLAVLGFNSVFALAALATYGAAGRLLSGPGSDSGQNVTEKGEGNMGAWSQILRSPLSRMIVMAVFGAFLFTELFALTGTYFSQRTALSVRLIQKGQQSIAVLVGVHPPRTFSKELSETGQRIVGKLDLDGAALYDRSGTEIASFGQAPTERPASFGAGIRSDGIIGWKREGDSVIAAVDFPAADPPVQAVMRLPGGMLDESLGIFIRNTIGIVLLIGLGVTLVTLTILGRQVVRPLLQIRRSLETGGAADGRDLPLDKEDEIGELARAVKSFQDQRSELDRLRDEQAEKEERAREEKKRSMESLADSFQEIVGNVVRDVASTAGNMHRTASEMHESARDTRERSLSVAGSAEQASASVDTVAKAAEDLSVSISRIVHQIQQSREMTDNAAGEAESVNAKVANLDEAARRIGEVVTLINDIAEQTNLLALNATIEAARAGEAGKGFAVVAGEVKSLANQTARATQDIDTQVRAIQDATEMAVNSIQGITDTIRNLNSIAAEISVAMDEQGMATGQIAESVQQVAAGTRDVSDTIGGVTRAARAAGEASSSMLDASAGLNSQSEKLDQAVQTFLGRIRAS